jgi:hypothetical protein
MTFELSSLRATQAFAVAPPLPSCSWLLRRPGLAVAFLHKRRHCAKGESLSQFTFSDGFVPCLSIVKCWRANTQCRTWPSSLRLALWRLKPGHSLSPCLPEGLTKGGSMRSGAKCKSVATEASLDRPKHCRFQDCWFL